MGGGLFSEEFYEAAKSERAKTGADAFAYTSAVRSGKMAEQCHELMDPKGVIREARDSAEHPETLPVMIILDETGSMETPIRTIQSKLGTTMNLLVQKGFAPHPSICFCGVGDARSDRAPLQVGQFEADNRIEKWLNELLWIENGGGGQVPPSESYGLGLYFAARHVKTDAFEKRGRQGYLFMIGDEQGYPIARDEVSRIIGDKIESDISIEAILPEVKKLWNPFFIIPRDAYHGAEKSIEDYWVHTVGREHVIMLDTAEAIAETIATTIGACEGTVTLDEALSHINDKALVKVVANGVSNLAAVQNGGLAKMSGKGLAKGTSRTERL